MEAYLDNAATTMVAEPARKKVLEMMELCYGNPSSRHSKGFEAEKTITAAKKIIADTLKCDPREILFTSGGTESNNMALIGTAYANQRSGKHIITTRIEHASVHEPLAFLEEQGFTVTYLPVNENGIVSKEELLQAIDDETILISLMHVNNEVGSIQPLEMLVQAARKKKPDVIIHVDGIQAYGKVKINPGKADIDLYSVSGHKIHGPKGVGFLYIRDKTKIKPLIYGGGQQKGMRSGTENVPGIAGLGEAVQFMYSDFSGHREKLYGLKSYLLELLKEKVTDYQVNGLEGISITDTAPHIVSVSFRGIRSEVLLHALAAEGVYVSSGSACSSNHPELSGTLKAIGVEDSLLDSTLRFSFSVFTTKQELEYAVDKLAELLPKLRKYTRH